MTQPEIVFRNGSCSAAVFDNAVDGGAVTGRTRSIQFQNSYRDRDGAWQTTTLLRSQDLPKAVLVLNKAYEYLTSAGGDEDQGAP
jgi:hypothetical protein